MRAILLIMVTIVTAPDRPDLKPRAAPPSALSSQQIQGEWLMVDAIVRGKSTISKGRIVIFQGEQFHIVAAGAKASAKSRYTYRLDLNRQPAEFDIVYPGKDKVKSIPGIIRMEGDRLVLCYGLNNERPTTFTAGPKTGLWTMKRVK
jgi:uncharacterized protein (TIGR03067 family)